MHLESRVAPRRLALPRILSVSAIAVAALLSLGACAPAIHTGGGHHGPSGTASSSSATPSATPTPVVVAPPVSRIPLTCEQLAPKAQVASVMGLTLVPTLGLLGVSDLEQYAYTQAGGIDCDYTTAHPDTDLGFYEVKAIPDVTPSAWSAHVAAADLVGYNIKPSPFGANSYLDCTATYHDTDCDLSMLIGSTVLDIHDYTYTQPTASNAHAEAHMLPLLTVAVNAIKGITVAEPAWTDPNATTVSLPGTPAGVLAAISTGVGFTVSPSMSFGQEPDPSLAESFAETPVGFGGYYGDAPHFEFTVHVLPAGSWAWSQIVASASTHPGYTVLSGVGDQAISYLSSSSIAAHEGIVEATKGDNLISVEIDTTEPAQIPNLIPEAKKTALILLSHIG